MQGRRGYAAVSPLINTIWSCRENALSLRKNSSRNCVRKRLECMDDHCLDDRDFASKRTRFNDDSVDNSTMASNEVNNMYSQKCHDTHHGDIELAQSLLGVVQDKRSFRLANMYGYYCRGSRRLRRMLSSLAQNVQEKNFYNALQSFLNEHYMREVELRKFADATMFAASPVLTGASDQFSTDTMDSGWYCPNGQCHLNGESGPHQFMPLSTDQMIVTGPANGGWNVAQNSGAQFVSEETDLMDISRNTVSGGAATGLDWAPSFGTASPPQQALLVVDANCYGDDSCQDPLDLDHICIYDHADLGEHGYCPNGASEEDVMAAAEHCWETVAAAGQPGAERPATWRQSSMTTVGTFGRNGSAPADEEVAISLKSSNVDFKSIAGMA